MNEEVENSVSAMAPETSGNWSSGESAAAVEPAMEAVIAPVDEPAPPSAGEQLRAARQAKGMSIAEVAQSLMLAQRQIEAIEADDWAKLPGETFVRGFIRNYARLLKLDSDALLQRKNEQAAEAAADVPNIELPQALAAEIPQAGHAKKRDKATILAAGGMVVAALLVYFLLPENLFTPSADKKVAEDTTKPSMLAPAPAPIADAPAAQPVPAAPPAAADPVAPAANVPAAPAPAAAAPVAAPTVPAPTTSPVTAAPTAAASTAVPVGAMRLKFSFSDESWVELTDKTGQKLLSSKNSGGSEREVAGVPPLTLVVGNASHVKLLVNGKAMELAPRSKDDVARLIVQ